MASKTGIASLGPFVLRTQAGLLVQPDEVAQKIENMYPSEEGSLRSVWGPCSLIDQPTYQETADGQLAVRPSSTSKADEITESPRGSIVYGERMSGIYHCLLHDNQRDVLLLHTENEIWEFTGWNGCWRKLVAEDIASNEFGYAAEAKTFAQASFPTQFECTGNGVVIVPQNSRPLFYDGYKIGPLGFERRPAPPSGRGPSNSTGTLSKRGVGVNDNAYAHDGTPWFHLQHNYKSGMQEGFPPCRIGTVTGVQYDVEAFYQNVTGDASATNKDALIGAGWLLHGEWRCKVQFIDQFGNLSALSESSDGVTVAYQPTVIPQVEPGDPPGETQLVPLDALKKQLAWTGIATGPDGCIGRVLYRTKDLQNSGDGKYYYLPLDTSSVMGAFATLPDNVTEIYPDNIADNALVVEAKRIDPAPRFKLCCVAFGRLWIGNTDLDPNVVQASFPGKWGTFDSDMKLYPDPTAETTGLHRCDRGLLAFTAKGTYLIQASDDGARFRSSPISSEVGCVAPSSVVTLGDGRVIWLGYDGFYTYDGASLAYASGPLRKNLRKLTRTRMRQACATYDPRSREYRCWVSINGSETNNICYIFDGKGWRTRTDVEPGAVCTTRDHRNLVLAAGNVTGDVGHTGVFALDRASNRLDTSLTSVLDTRESVIETSWMTAHSSKERKTTRVVYLWLRETENSKLTIEVMRDWRSDVIETALVDRYTDEDVPPFWATTPLDSGKSFTERRPYWTRAQIYVPSNEVFKFRIRGTGFWEFIGLQVDIAPRGYGGAQIPP
ncbi:MAG: hypothetical protein Tp1123DCM257201_6 [Prokaryotic dsDNA virus sp.]|nr:MAG: hypothetical protein Tp1123DCM257201_6 [Prokaryotic dsDNA virus sp.]